MCVCISLWSLCGISLIFSQYGGAIHTSSEGVTLTFEGSAMFTSCSAEASGSSALIAVSGGE